MYRDNIVSFTREVVVAEGAGLGRVHLARGTSNHVAGWPWRAFLLLPFG